MELSKKEREFLLDKMIEPIALPRHTYQVEIRDLEREFKSLESFGCFELNPDFQRGHVWTEKQQLAYVEAILRGTVGKGSLLLTLNCPNWEYEPNPDESDLPLGVQCVDGLQRITALLRAYRGEIKPFGFSAEHLKGTKYSLDSRNYYVTFQMMTFQNRFELLKYYLAINTGGTPHSREEICRVEGLLNNTVSIK